MKKEVIHATVYLLHKTLYLQIISTHEKDFSSISEWERLSGPVFGFCWYGLDPCGQDKRSLEAYTAVLCPVLSVILKFLKCFRRYVKKHVDNLAVLHCFSATKLHNSREDVDLERQKSIAFINIVLLTDLVHAANPKNSSDANLHIIRVAMHWRLLLLNFSLHWPFAVHLSSSFLSIVSSFCTVAIISRGRTCIPNIWVTYVSDDAQEMTTW